MSEIITAGLDLAKSVFQVHGADASGRGVLRKKLAGPSSRFLQPPAVPRRCYGNKLPIILTKSGGVTSPSP